MKTNSKRPWVITYSVSVLLPFLGLAYQSYPADKWLWSSFVFAILFSPFVYFLVLIGIGAFEEPFNWLVRTIKRILGKNS